MTGSAVHTPPTATFPGDELLENAPMMYDQQRFIRASPEEIWPWLMQLGKARGGWYAPWRIERFFPRTWRATRSIEPTWQTIEVGQRISDYGSAEDYLEVVALEHSRYIVFCSERYGTQFTWAIFLQPRGENTQMHLRFRGNIRSTGLRQKLIVTGGRWLDWVTTTPMLAGLAERVESR